MTPTNDRDAPSTGFTRRQVLVALGALGGAGVVLGSLGAMELVVDDGPVPFDPPKPSDFTLQGRMNDVEVVVLGAGIAGLCCAYELGNAGYRVTVVDARQRVGGRCWTVRGGDEVTDTRGATQRCDFVDGRWLNAGPGRIAQHHTTLSYCRELGVPIEIFVNVNTDAYVANRGVVRRRRSVQADLDGYISELLIKALGTDVLDAEISQTEVAMLIEHLQLIGALGGSHRGFEGMPHVDREQPIVGEPDTLNVLLQLGFGERLYFERDIDQAAPMFHPTGGMDTIATALVNASRAEVRLGRTVTSIRNTSDGVEIVTTDESGTVERITADFGICTLPPHLIVGLESDFDTDVTRALSEPQPVTTGKIGLEYDRRFWETDEGIFGGITACDPSIRDIWYPSTGYLGKGGVLIGAYPFGEPADRFSRLPHDERLQLALTAGAAVHGAVYRDELRSSFSVDWATQQHSVGAWSLWSNLDDGYKRLQQSAGRWWFAGDWLARTPGWQHGAFESARRSVTALHQQALRS